MMDTKLITMTRKIVLVLYDGRTDPVALDLEAAKMNDRMGLRPLTVISGPIDVEFTIRPEVYYS